MSDNVVEFPGQDREIWLCKCGCETHYIYVDGTVECAGCGNEGPHGVAKMKVTPETLELEATHAVRVLDVDFALKRAAQRLAEPDVAGVAVFYNSGRLYQFFIDQPETDDEKDWWVRQMNKVLDGLGIEKNE